MERTSIQTLEGKSTVIGSIIAMLLPLLSQLTGLPQETIEQLLNQSPYALGLVAVFVVAKLLQKWLMKKEEAKVEIAKIQAGQVQP